MPLISKAEREAAGVKVISLKREDRPCGRSRASKGGPGWRISRSRSATKMRSSGARPNNLKSKSLSLRERSLGADRRLSMPHVHTCKPLDQHHYGCNQWV